jgi:hypothetical protein
MLGRRRLLALPLFALFVLAAIEGLPRTVQPDIAGHRPASVVAGIRSSPLDAVLPSHRLGERPTTHRPAGAVAPVAAGVHTRFTALLPEFHAPAPFAAPLPLVAPRAPPALG